MYKKTNTPWPCGIYSKYAKLTQYSKVNQCNPLHQKSKEKNRKLILIDAEKALNKIQYPFIIKIPSNLGI